MDWFRQVTGEDKRVAVAEQGLSRLEATAPNLQLMKLWSWWMGMVFDGDEDSQSRMARPWQPLDSS